MKSLPYLLFVLVSSLFGVILLPILTHHLNETEVGKYALVSGVLQLSLIIPNFSISMIVIRFFPSYENLLVEFQNVIVKKAFHVFLIISIALNIGIAVYNYFVDSFILYDNVIITFLFASVMSYKIMLSFVQSKNDSSFYAFVGISELIIRFILTIVFLYLNFEHFSVFMAMLISTSIVTLFSMKMHTVFRDFTIQSVNNKLLKGDVNKFTKPLVYSAILMWVLSTSDQYMINFFINESYTGVYMTGYVIPFQIITLFTTALMLEFEPKISKQFSRNNLIDIDLMYNSYFSTLIIFTIPIIILGSYFSQDLYKLIYGAGFWSSSVLFPYIVFAAFFWALYKAFYQNLIIRGKLKSVVLILLISSIVNISLNIYLIPKYGIKGAAISTAFAYLILSVLSYAITTKYTKYSLNYMLLLIVLISSILILGIDKYYLKGLIDVKQGAVYRIVIAMIIYLIFMFVTKRHKYFLFFKK